MSLRNILFGIVIMLPLTMSAQFLNFSLRTNNQQLIDMAMDASFLKIGQSYELCDTTKKESFGRGGENYFSIIPFIGVQTERGVVCSLSIKTPWNLDEDFNEYRGKYKPIVSNTNIVVLNNTDGLYKDTLLVDGVDISKHTTLLFDSSAKACGLKVDTLSGLKDGWLIWLSSSTSLLQTDSVKLISVYKKIEVPSEGGYLNVGRPEISDNVYGGIYVTPIQTAIGQLMFSLTGILVQEKNGWIIDFPFVKKSKTLIESKSLTPIKESGLNPLKRKTNEKK